LKLAAANQCSRADFVFVKPHERYLDALVMGKFPSASEQNAFSKDSWTRPSRLTPILGRCLAMPHYD